MARPPEDGKKNAETRVILKTYYNYDSESGVSSTINYYADELPCEAKMYTVLSVIGSIIATPLILLFCIPNLKSIKKVQ